MQDDVVVQVIFEVLRTLATAMSVVDAKDLKFRPFIIRNSGDFLGRLDYVEDN